MSVVNYSTYLGFGLSSVIFFVSTAARVDMSFFGRGSSSKGTLSCNLMPLHQLLSIFNYTSIVVYPNGEEITSP